MKDERKGFYISVKTAPNTYQHFNVPEAVYTYIRQLENAIMCSNKQGIKRLYKERFTNE